MNGKKVVGIISTILIAASLLLPAPALAVQARILGLLFDRPVYVVGPPEFRSTAFSDLAESGAVEEFTLLAALDVFRGEQGRYGPARPAATVTRAELTAIVVRLLGQEAVADWYADKNVTLPYSDAADIPSWARGYALVASDFKFVRGIPTPDGGLLFAAERPVLFRDAVTLMKRLVQWSDPPWPESALEDLEAALTGGLEENDLTEGITREDMAVLAVNTLKAGRYNGETGRLDPAQSLLNSRYEVKEGLAVLNGGGTALNLRIGNRYETVPLAPRGFLRGASSLEDLRGTPRHVIAVYNSDRRFDGIVYIAAAGVSTALR